MPVKNISLLRNPLNGGRPAIEKAPITVRVKETGIMAASPPSLRMSRVPSSWSRIPMTMNRQPLKTEWLMRWNRAAATAPERRIARPCSMCGVRAIEPMPSRLMISPSWLTVEKASMAFRST